MKHNTHIPVTASDWLFLDPRMIVLGKNVSKAKGEDERSGSYTVLTTDLESNEDGHLAAFEFHVAKAGLIRLQVLVLS